MACFMTSLCIAVTLVLVKSELEFNHSLSNNQVERAFLRLLALHAKTCPYISWCTLNNITASPVVLVPSYRSIPCCHKCSCTSRCLDDGDCCPDYDLVSTFGRNSFENISELFMALSQETYSFFTHANIPQIQNHENGTNANRKFRQCVRAHVLINSDVIQHGMSYKMIATCPDNYNDSETSNRCELPILDLENLHSISEILPITSLISGDTFKNKFCLKCNNGHTGESVIWDMILACRFMNEPFGTYLIDNPYNLLRYFSLHKKKCNLIFEPNEIINRKYPAEQCTHIDVMSCSNTHTSENVTRPHDEALIAACEMYTSVVSVNKFTEGYDVYNNIACLYCNGVDFQEKCYESYRRKAKFRVDISKLKDDDYPGIFEKFNFLNASFTNGLKETYGKCMAGYIYDKMQMSCRKVLCPRGTYAFNGSCVAVFDKTTGLLYKTVWKVIHSSLDTAETTDFEKQLFNYMKNVVENTQTIVIRNMSLWKNNTMDGYFVVLLMSTKNENKTYGNVVDTLFSIVTRTASIETKSKTTNRSQTVSLVIEVANHVRLARKALLNTYSAKPLQLIAPAVWSPDYRLLYMDITKSHICYRIKLDESEIHLDFYRSHLLVNPYDSIYGQYFACIDDVYKKERSGNSGKDDANVDVVYYKEKAFESIEFGMYIFFSCIFAIVAVRFTIIRCLKQRTVTAQTESNEIVHMDNLE